MRLSNITGILQKKTIWFIGVEVEQETSAPPPKKNPGSAPDAEQLPKYPHAIHLNLQFCFSIHSCCSQWKWKCWLIWPSEMRVNAFQRNTLSWKAFSLRFAALFSPSFWWHGCIWFFRDYCPGRLPNWNLFCPRNFALSKRSLRGRTMKDGPLTRPSRKSA